MSGDEGLSALPEPERATIKPDEVMRLAELLAATTSEMGDLIRKMERCIDCAVALVDSNTDPRAEGIIGDLRVVALSIQAVAKQIEHVSGAAVIVSSRSLADMGVQLQKAVARMAVAKVNLDDSDPPTAA